MLSRDELFLGTLDDLESRIALGRDEYDILMVAALLRKLLIDSDPLLHQVNRAHRMKVRFDVIRRMPPNDLIPTMWSIQDGLDPDTALSRRGQRLSVDLENFLALPVALVDRQVITVGALIRYLAHVAGAVHAGKPGNPVEEAIHRFALSVQIGGNVSGAVRSLLAIGRVVVKGLEPLRSELRSGRGGS